jgi:hypothetical protein
LAGNEAANSVLGICGGAGGYNQVVPVMTKWMFDKEPRDVAEFF